MSYTFSDHARTALMERPPAVEVVGTVEGTVDSFDAAAHLEAMGFGEQTAARQGFSSTFEHADVLVRSGIAGAQLVEPGARNARGGAWRDSWVAALTRSLVMLGGVVLCVITVAPSTPGDVVFAAGAASWPAGQIISCALWNGLSRADRSLSAAHATVLALGVFFTVAFVSVILESPLPLVWSLWTMAVAVLLVLETAPGTLLFVAPGAVLAGGLATLGGRLGALVAFWWVAVAVLLALRRLRIELKGTGRRVVETANSAVSSLVVLGFGQACALLIQLAFLMHAVGSELALSLAVAGLMASVMSEPVLDSALLVAKHLAARPMSWRELRWRMRLLAFSCILGTASLSLLLGIAIAAGMGHGADCGVLAGAILITCLATLGSGLQLRTGSAVGAFVVSAVCLALVVVGIATLGASAGVSLAAVVVLFFVCAVAAQRLSMATNW